MQDFKEFWTWYTGGTTTEFATKLVITFLIIITILLLLNIERIKSLFSRASNSYYIGNGDDKDLGKCWDEGLDNIQLLRQKINQIRDPINRYNEIKSLIQETEQHLIKLNERRIKIDNIYRDLYYEYDDLKKQVTQMEKVYFNQEQQYPQS